ncbi:hypothetical protein V2J09_015217, partial [Rumex salicifolius]
PSEHDNHGVNHIINSQIRKKITRNSISYSPITKRKSFVYIYIVTYGSSQNLRRSRFLPLSRFDFFRSFSHIDFSLHSAVPTLKMASEELDTSDIDSELFEEVDPTGRYGRYNELLGSGAVKKVYRAFDQEEGIEVAWNQANLKYLTDKHMIEQLHSEVRLLRTLKNKNIISLYSFWIDNEKSTFNFITEACTSGDLRKYRRKHKHVSLKALKKWSKQILAGLEYLHTHEPCVIHRDINCSNVFVNGNIGQVKIGDMGMAIVVGKSHAAHSILGTPEFMAPELYDEDYTELVDIYSFGMSLLELVTTEIPYSECNNIGKIYKKVTSGVWPEAMSKVKDAEFKAFIVKCIGRPRARPSASELLKDHFFDGVYDDENE